MKVLKSTLIPLKTKWQEFLRNDDNKTVLFLLISKSLVSSIKPDEAVIFATANENAITNSSSLAMTDVSPCNHEEADTCMFLHLKHGVEYE